jgi:hypothetical protein
LNSSGGVDTRMWSNVGRMIIKRKAIKRRVKYSTVSLRPKYMKLNTIKYANIRRERKLCIGVKTFEMVQKFKYQGAVIDDENNITRHTRENRVQQ